MNNRRAHFLTTLAFIIILLALPRAAFPASALLNWGSVPDGNLAGYKVYYQANSSSPPFNGTGAWEGSSPIDVANTTTATVNGLDPSSTYYFAITAYNTAGQESECAQPAPSAAQQAISTLWPGTTVPGIQDVGPDSAVELGVKFRADIDGYVTGIRFYKASTNIGTHVGNLWTSTGTLLSTATFTDETDSGWQQVNFSTPVAITANTVYVASYYTSAGHYSIDLNYFASKHQQGGAGGRRRHHYSDQNYFARNGVGSPPLHAPVDGVSGINGVFAYGSTSSFPDQGNGSNYWVDVAFSAATESSLSSVEANPTSFPRDIEPTPDYSTLFQP